MIGGIDDGGPAFPVPGMPPVGSGDPRDGMVGGCDPQHGMSLRDWFAGMALQGVLACPASSGKFSDFASDAYCYADAMLAARKEQS